MCEECKKQIAALIAENEELGRYLCTCRDCGGEGALHTGDWHSYGHMEPPEPVMEKCGECDGTGLLGEIQDLYQVITERDQLRAEISGLKTGYQAYERVNAELKAEVEALREEVALDDKIIADRDRLLNMFDCPAHGQCIPYAMEQIEALRKDAERYRAIRDEIPHVDLGRSIVSANNAAEYDAAIDAALGQGEQS